MYTLPNDPYPNTFKKSKDLKLIGFIYGLKDIFLVFYFLDCLN